MKKFTIAALAIVSLAACTKSELVDQTPAQEITYQTLTTKAAKPFDVNNKFISYAYFLEKDKNWDDKKGESTEYIKGAEISFISADNCWKNSTTTYYWPKQGSLTFFAWSDNTGVVNVPLGAKITCATNGINVADFKLGENLNCDLLIADVVKNQTKNTATVGGWKEGVPTVFRHALSDLVFNVKTKETYAGVEFVVKAITLTGVHAAGSFAQADVKGSWTVDSTTSELNVFTNISLTDEGKLTGTTPKTLVPAATDYHIVIPQTIPDGAKLVLEYVVKTNYGVVAEVPVKVEKNLKDIYTANWEFGKKYTLDITLGLDEILWAPSVEDWEVGTVAGIQA